jgi:phosphatidylinositol-3-phosphatase
MKKIAILFLMFLALASCAPSNPVTSTPQPGLTVTATTTQPVTSTPTKPVTSTATVTTSVAITTTPTPQAGTSGKIPNFDHIVLILLENRNYKDVIGNLKMPHLNILAQQNVLLSNYFAVRHPSLPNYIALMSGSTQNITNDCTDCFINEPNLADRIESSGRTWKSYLESMPSPCFIGDAKPYVQKHNPLIYFDSVRLDTNRCNRSVVPLTSLDDDLAANQLPNFLFIMPNMCNSGHDCDSQTADIWINNMVAKLKTSPALGKNSLIVITYDEGSEKSTGSCCGLGAKAGGQVATVLISPIAKQKFNDSTAYSHYSMLKMILSAWNLSDIGQSSSAPQIEAPWDTQQSPTTGSTSTPTTISHTPVFSDGFETGNLSSWTSSSGLLAQSTLAHNGNYAVQGDTMTGNTYAKNMFPSSYGDGYSRIYFNLVSYSSQVNLLRYRTSTDTSIGYLFINTSGNLGLRNDVAAVTTTSTTTVGSGWHALEFHAIINGTSSITQVWLDGVKINDLSLTTNLGGNLIGGLQIGEVQGGRTYNIILDDVIFDTLPIGL